MNSLKLKTVFKRLLIIFPMLMVALTMAFAVTAVNSGHQLSLSGGKAHSFNINLTGTTCGHGSNAVNTSIDFGCQGVGNPITDLLFAIIRFLSAGVGLVVVASVIVGGIQYIGARGEPANTQKAVNRLVNSLVALLIFIFAYAILNFVIPGGFFK